MSGILRISEAEAARDFSAVMDRALAGDEIVVRRGDDEVVLLMPANKNVEIGRPLRELIESAKRRKAEWGLTKVDDDFAADMEKIHAEMNHPLDGSKWD